MNSQERWRIEETSAIEKTQRTCSYEGIVAGGDLIRMGCIDLDVYIIEHHGKIFHSSDGSISAAILRLLPLLDVISQPIEQLG